MSDKPISVGDLVVKVRAGHCGGLKYLGVPFVVTELSEGRFCTGCFTHFPGTAARSADGWKVAVALLKRIDPPAQQTDESHKEELHA